MICNDYHEIALTMDCDAAQGRFKFSFTLKKIKFLTQYSLLNTQYSILNTQYLILNT